MKWILGIIILIFAVFGILLGIAAVAVCIAGSFQEDCPLLLVVHGLWRRAAECFQRLL